MQNVLHRVEKECIACQLLSIKAIIIAKPFWLSENPIEVSNVHYIFLTTLLPIDNTMIILTHVIRYWSIHLHTVLQLCNGRLGNDRYSDRGMQTINDAPKIKQTQTDKVVRTVSHTHMVVWSVYVICQHSETH